MSFTVTIATNFPVRLDTAIAFVRFPFSESARGQCIGTDPPESEVVPLRIRQAPTGTTPAALN
ncbi:MAG: hypothetical protein LBI05_10220 [Planctomycetaceae bacterium]|nr:hypothetical protein [Planctomycetaceae bacterium]